MPTIKNKSEAQRGIYDQSGELIWLNAGETREDINLDGAGLIEARGSGFFAFDEDALQADALDELAVARARISELEVEVTDLRDQLAAFDHDGDGKAGGSKPGPATAEEIVSAVNLLDGKNDDHWTSAGLPAVDAIAELTGKTVTRAGIAEAAPDSKRPAD